MNLDAADRAKLSEEELVASMPTVPLDDANLYLRFGFRLALSAHSAHRATMSATVGLGDYSSKDPKAIDKIPHQGNRSLKKTARNNAAF